MQITLRGDQLELRFPPDPDALAKVRALPSRRFDAAVGAWFAPHTRENYEALRLYGFDLAGIPAPTASGYAIDARDGLLKVTTPFAPRNVELCRAIPDHHMWHAGSKAWLCGPTPRNAAYLRSAFPDAAWTPAAEALLAKAAAAVRQYQEADAALREQKAALRDDDALVTDYKFGGPPPFKHQRRAFLLSRDRAAFALLMEQGTGKTKVIIDTACWLHARGKIAQVLVVAPNSVKTNWVTDELPAHTPGYVTYRAAYWGAGSKEQQRQVDAIVNGEADPTVLRWLVMNVEALSVGGGAAVAEKFLRQAPTLFCLDESSRIKTPGAKRTRAAVRLGKLAAYRRICSGTPITQGPLDAFAQFRFLDPHILFGFESYAAFRTHFAILGGYQNHQVIGYAHLDELKALIEPHSYRVLRSECLDLPPKIYQRLDVDLAPEARRAYDQMRDEMIAELRDRPTVTAAIILTQLLRLQQITGGFLPVQYETADGVYVGEQAEPIPGSNAKLEALLDLVGDVTGKVIVWARFRAELAAIAAALRERYGPEAAVEFHGGIKDEARILARTAFQDPASPVRFFVGQTETGGMGLTLTEAKTVVYFSNSFSLESRLQSEDRAHRIGQTGSVTYVDLVARDTVDLKVLAALRSKKDLAANVTGDAWKEWI